MAGPQNNTPEAQPDPGSIRHEALERLASVDTENGLRDWKASLFGKQGKVSAALRAMATMTAAQRKANGPPLHALRDELMTALSQRRSLLQKRALEAALAREGVDLTLPAAPKNSGRLHPLSDVINQVCAIFTAMGFEQRFGPDIEDDFHNFSALNFPQHHPARDSHDTFFVSSQLLLRTHTSTVQIRTMQKEKPPLRIIAPGRAFRRDSDMTHSPMFHQIEGMVIDKHITMAHLKGCLMDFIDAFFGPQACESRFRPHFFPFTEPSAEMDIRMQGKNSRNKWLEILGCGMVHPNVLRQCGVDPGLYQGFAFGMGLDRLCMLRHGIEDLRALFASPPDFRECYGRPWYAALHSSHPQQEMSP